MREIINAELGGFFAAHGFTAASPKQGWDRWVDGMRGWQVLAPVMDLQRGISLVPSAIARRPDVDWILDFIREKGQPPAAPAQRLYDQQAWVYTAEADLSLFRPDEEVARVGGPLWSCDTDDWDMFEEMRASLMRVLEREALPWFDRTATLAGWLDERREGRPNPGWLRMCDAAANWWLGDMEACHAELAVVPVFISERGPLGPMDKSGVGLEDYRRFFEDHDPAEFEQPMLAALEAYAS
jgi:hypothetical protein